MSVGFREFDTPLKATFENAIKEAAVAGVVVVVAAGNSGEHNQRPDCKTYICVLNMLFR